MNIKFSVESFVFQLLTKNIKITIKRTVILLVLLYFCEAWSHIEGGTYTEGVQE
jgi:hypothetical protein